MTFTEHRYGVLAFLTQRDTPSTPHIFGDLYSHLTGVESLVRAWGGSDRLALVALAHATYGTDGFAPNILELEERPLLASIIGPEAEALVYFYASCDRRYFYPQIEAPDTVADHLAFRDRFTDTTFTPSPAYVTDFVDLTLANECELAAASPGGPLEWTWLSDFCRTTQRWASPGFSSGAGTLLGLAG
jgi:hypothetical protein